MTNSKEYISSILCNPAIGNSDHVIISGMIHTITKKLSRSVIRIPCFKNTDWTEFNLFLINNFNLNKDESIENCFTYFSKLIKTGLKRFVPYREYYEFKSNIVSKPIYKLYQRARRQFLKFKATNDRVYLKKHRLLKQRFLMILKRSQTLFENSLLELQNQRKFFSFINRRIKTKYNITSLTLNDGSETEDLDLITKELNLYFGSVYHKCGSIDIDLSADDKDVIVFSRTTLNAAIKQLSNSKCGGYDMIPPNFWQYLSTPNRNLLLSLFNKIANSNFFS